MAGAAGTARLALAFADRNVMERSRPAAHWSLILAARITLAHFSVSSAMSLPKSASVIGIGTLPRSARRALMLGSGRAALISLLSFSTISTGVPFDAPNPFQRLAS